jgi:hypothetical protein
MGYDSKIWLKFDPFGIDKECYDHLEDVNVKELPYIKFGGGHNILYLFQTDQTLTIF